MNEAVESLRWKKFPVLDDGFVSLVDVMGDDAAIVQAARVSYGEGTKKVSDDRNLIRYLLRHRHTTPFEMAEVKLLVRVSMDTWRQWIRHRTACLAGNTIVSFDLPSGKTGTGLPRHYPLTVREIYDRFQPTVNSTRPDKQRNPYFKRDRLQTMRLRSFDERSGTLTHVRVADIWESGVKPILRVEFPNGNILRASKDHLCLTDLGWLKLQDALAQRAMFQSTDKLIVDLEQMVQPPVDVKRERWADIAGYDGHYQVSTDGSQTKTKQVHTLVLEAFVGQCPPNQEGRHRNHNRLDNRLSNLQYGTKQDNSDDRMESGCNQQLTPTYVAPISWRHDGEEMTYDLEVAGIDTDLFDRNFFAGGVVVHNSVNEYSTRYSLAIDSAQHTPPDQWRAQSDSNKQGSRGNITDDLNDVTRARIDAEVAQAGFELRPPHTIGELLSEQEEQFLVQARKVYEDRIACGMAREQARKDLPLSTYTEAYWKCDLHNLLHFLALRMDSHAQHEIRQYATIIGEEIIKPLFPLAWEAFCDYRLGGAMLTRHDIAIIKHIIAHSGSGQGPFPTTAFNDACALSGPAEWSQEKCRERDESLAKMVRIGLIANDGT